MSTQLTALNITPLTGFVLNGNKFDIEWSYSGPAPTYFQITRYIGSMTSVGPTMPDNFTFSTLTTASSSSF